MEFSALDQSPVFEGGTPAQALQDTLRCVEACDDLGLKRYWVAEHHGSRSFAGFAPEVLMALLLSRTRRIRVGSGGIMLNHYSPFKVAENFRLLATLFPDRVDLGIGRAPGSDPVQAGALAYGSQTTTADFYPTKVADLIAWVKGEKPATEAFRRVAVTPDSSTALQMWQLASSEEGAMYAAHFGLPLALAHFIVPECLAAAGAYRKALAERNARIVAEGGEPDEGRIALAVFAICADTEEEAIHLASSANWWRRRVGSGRFGRFVPPDKAAQNLAEQPAASDDNRQRALVGTQQQIIEKLKPLLAESGADELMVVTICAPVEARIRSYELLAEVVADLSPEGAV